MDLSTLKPPSGSRKKRHRIGRGEASGWGKTSGRGHKGAKSRSGYSRKPGFEGGQMPLKRRLPKRGFTNIFKTSYQLVNLRQLCNERFADCDRFDIETLCRLGMVKKADKLVKVLGCGELTRAVTVEADKFSEACKKKIEDAGGTVILRVRGQAKAAENTAE